MFFRTKKVKTYEYLQIVESCRENGRMRQRVMMTLGNYQLTVPSCTGYSSLEATGRR
jgi:hypothetical protein